MLDDLQNRRFLPALAAIFAALTAALPASAEFTSRLQVGNWQGGAWADNTTKEFRNCGLTLQLSGGTAVSIIVPANLSPAIMLADPKIKAQPRTPLQVKAKFGNGADLALNAMGISNTMVQIPMPVWPHNYDMMRRANEASFNVTDLNTKLNVAGIAQALPQVIGCAIAERAKMPNPPSPAPAGQPFEKTEATLAGLVIAERAGIGNYIVFPDNERPGNFQQAAMVAGYVGAQGPGGAANILLLAYFSGPLGATPQEAKQAIVGRMKAANPNTVIADLPAIPGKARSFGVSGVGNNAYEEFYLVEKPGKGWFQFATATPNTGRATAEAAGAKLRQAISLVFPY